MFPIYELWQYYSSSDSEGDEMSKTRRTTENELPDPPPGEGEFENGGTANTLNETYDGLMVWAGKPWGFSPRNPQSFEVGALGYTGPPIGGRQNLDFRILDTIAGVPSVTSHAPAGIGWITAQAWANSTWNGVPYDVTGKTKSQICNFVFPTSNTMRGLRQLYEQAPPFANPRFPEPWEIDLWNIKVINHFRALFGIPPIQPSVRLYNEAQWSTVRRWTNKYTAAYPANGQPAYGPCPTTTEHCGATFLPVIGEQDWLLLPPGVPAAPAGTAVSSMVRQSVAEALGGVDTDIPWSIKLGRVLAIFLCYEGIVGHTGGFLRRQKIGMIFHDLGDGTTQVRFKFGGTYTPFGGI